MSLDHSEHDKETLRWTWWGWSQVCRWQEHEPAAVWSGNVTLAETWGQLVYLGSLGAKCTPQGKMEVTVFISTLSDPNQVQNPRFIFCFCLICPFFYVFVFVFVFYKSDIEPKLPVVCFVQKTLRTLNKVIFPRYLCAGLRVTSCASSLCEAVVLKLFLFLSVVVSHSSVPSGMKWYVLLWFPFPWSL